MRGDFYAEYFRIEDRHWWFVGRREIVLAVLSARLTPAENGGTARILDFGCGTGTMLGHLQRFGEVEGVDADEQAVRYCHARGHARVQLLASDVLPFPEDSFELVTALDVLEHIEDDRRALEEIARVLRPGGALLATVPAYQWMWGAQDEISHHVRRYASRQLGDRILAAGLDLERLTHFNTILFAPIAAVRLARKLRSPKGHPHSDFEMTRERAANRLLADLFSAEARWLRSRDLPFGVSVLALATAPRR
jgi:SAM-dependent methyltransferase